eukprot:gene42416-51809_t
MRALSQLCYHRNSQFIYFTRALPASLLQQPVGNLRHALSLGMKLFPVSYDADYRQLMLAKGIENVASLPSIVEALQDSHVDDALFVPTGASSSMAKEGVAMLCEEMLSFVDSQASDKPWKVLFACGTGTMAFYAHKCLMKLCGNRIGIDVVAVPCVGDERYLQEQMLQYSSGDHDTGDGLPDTMPASPKRVFATPYPFHYKIWRHVCRSSQIDFDLLYAPRVFEVLLDSCGVNEDSNNEQQLSEGLKGLFPGYNILYYHCGGVEANESQLARYRYKLGASALEDDSLE